MLTVEIKLYQSDQQSISWLKQRAFPIMLRWLKNIDHHGCRSSDRSIRLVNLHNYVNIYRRIKDTHGRYFVDVFQSHPI
jgi:hypothetical protein